MISAPVVAVVLVTHDSAQILGPTLRSIDQQNLAPAVRIAIDDSSSYETVQLLETSNFDVERSTSTSRDVLTRIAHNFFQGVRAATRAGADIVVLGDHDDVWHPKRTEHQVRLLNESPRVAMVASDGYLIDEYDAAIPGTIRQSFPVPDDFMSLRRSKQLSYALRHSIATGGACSIRPANLKDWSVPPGWLHDRWWSLESLRRKQLLIDATPVIDYRVTDSQQVGLDQKDQDHPRRWVAAKAVALPSTSRRFVQLSRLLRK